MVQPAAQYQRFTFGRVAVVAGHAQRIVERHFLALHKLDHRADRRRDRHNALQSSEFPQATFKPTKIEGLPASVKPGDQITLKVTGDLTVKQTTKPVTFDVTLTVAQDKLTGTATTEILLSDFGVGPIQIAILQTEDTAKLAFDFVALPAQ